MTEEEKELVRRSMGGDREAFAAVYRLAWPAVYSSVLREIHDWDEARAVTQDAFLQAWKGIGGLREPDRFGGWMRTVAGNEVRKWRGLADHRAAARKRPIEDAANAPDPRAPDPPASALGREVRALVLEEVRGHPEPAREVILLRLLSGLEYHEIGERLGLPLQQAKNLGIRGIARLAKRLGERLGEQSAP